MASFDKHVDAMTVKASGLISSRYGLWFLGLLSFVESSLVIPLITDPFMAAYILVHRGKVLVTVLVTTLTSVFGGFIAYVTAAFFIDLILVYLSPETVEIFNGMIENYRHETFALAFLGALTPIPFTLAALVAGTIKGNLLLFLLGALVGRFLRYGIVGYLTYKFGAPALVMARKNIGIFSIITIVVIGLYLWLKM